MRTFIFDWGMNFLKGEVGLSKVHGFLLGFPHLDADGSVAHIGTLHGGGGDFDSGKQTH